MRSIAEWWIYGEVDWERYAELLRQWGPLLAGALYGAGQRRRPPPWLGPTLPAATHCRPAEHTADLAASLSCPGRLLRVLQSAALGAWSKATRLPPHCAATWLQAGGAGQTLSFMRRRWWERATPSSTTGLA